VRIYTRNRAAAVKSYGELYQQYADPLSDDFQQARKQLEGMEQYLLQLWRES
jgi:ribosomal protein S17E